jgi:hydroxymethylpyrimidine pyrophosphatase-like HAD family hydrolase
MPSTQLIAVDLDGTLFFPGKGIHPQEVATLEALARRSVVRVLATGRNWKSVCKVLGPDFPIDYLVFSSGAGIVEWSTQTLLVSHNLSTEELETARGVFASLELDHMIHEPIPESHRFVFQRCSSLPNPDYEARLALHKDFARGFTKEDSFPVGASQVLGVCPKGDPDEPFAKLRAALPKLSIVRATSPLDGKSIWLEAFSAHASKSKGTDWVAKRYGISSSAVLAVGNDYNDWDLLSWAGCAFVMDSAPEVLRKNFPSVLSSGTGVTEAVARWASDAETP